MIMEKDDPSMHSLVVSVVLVVCLNVAKRHHRIVYQNPFSLDLIHLEKEHGKTWKLFSSF